MNSIPLILFAKAPVVGRVKTRLQSHCSAQQASDIAKILLEQSIIKATQAWPGQVTLSVWLDHEHEFIQQMEQRYPISLVQQSAGDLGAKMSDALDRLGYPAAVIGADVPHLPDSVLLAAHRCLSEGRSVIGPSTDGGYYLLGLNCPQPELFTDMEWGVDTVLQNTLQTASDLGLKLSTLDVQTDIDEWVDLIIASKKLPELARYLDKEALHEAS